MASSADDFDAVELEEQAESGSTGQRGSATVGITIDPTPGPSHATQQQHRQLSHDDDEEENEFLGSTQQSDMTFREEPNACIRMFCASPRRGLALLFLIVVVVIIIAVATSSKSSGNSGDSGTPNTVGPTGQWYDLRLPKTVVPMHYTLSLFVDMAALHYSGTVSIDVNVTDSRSAIWLHAIDFNMTQASVFQHQASGKKTFPISEQFYYAKNEFYVLRLGEQLSPGSYVVALSFDRVLDDSLRGFYRSTYKENGVDKFIATTQFEPTDARRAFPCFDEPAMKANFTIAVVHPTDTTALSNMPETTANPWVGRPGFKRTQFTTSVRMSTYLVAFIVCDFAHITGSTTSGHRVSVWTPAEEINQAHFALTVAIQTIEYYEQFFGIPYPLAKMDMAAIPDFAAGAMENWGLITYRQHDLLYDPRFSSSADKFRVAAVVAHELAHQWFGNLVTMDWWSDLWLNEGFASFTEYEGMNHMFPEWKVWNVFHVSSQRYALELDSLPSSHPIHVEVHNPTEINEIFDAISYSKGASVIFMMRKFLGDSIFQQGLNRYLTAHSYHNARTEDLWAAMSAESAAQGRPLNVTIIMDSWTRQKGYPLVALTLNSGGVASVSQHVFTLIPDNSSARLWRIPLAYASEAHSTNVSTTWLNTDRGAIPYSPSEGYIKLNMHQRGLYRVLYPNTVRQALANKLLTASNISETGLTAPDRAGLVDDLFNLVLARMLTYNESLSFIRFLPRETDWTVLSTAVGMLDQVRERIITRPFFGKFESFVHELLSNHFVAASWGDQPVHGDDLVVTVVMRLKLDAASIPEGSVQRSTFDDQFKLDLAKAVDVQESRVQIDSISAVGTPGNPSSLNSNIRLSMKIFPSQDININKQEFYWASRIAARIVSQANDTASDLYKGVETRYIDPAFRPVVTSQPLAAQTSYQDKRWRRAVLGAAYTYNYKAAHLQGNERFQALRAASSQYHAGNFTVSPEVLSLVYAAGIRQGATEDWDWLWSIYPKASVSEKRGILWALAQSREPWQLSKYLSFTLNSTAIRKQDVVFVVRYVAGNVIGRQVVWDFVQEHFDALVHGGFATGSIISSTTAHFDTQEGYDEVDNFFNSGSRVGLFTSTVKRALERIQTNIAWRATHESVIASWLATNVA